MKALVMAWGGHIWLGEIAAKSLRRKCPDLDVSLTDWKLEHPGNFSRLLKGEMGRHGRPLYMTPADTFAVGPISFDDLLLAREYLEMRTHVVRLNVTGHAEMENWGTVVDEFFGREYVECARMQHCSGPGGLMMDAAVWSPWALAECLEPGWAIDMVETWGTRQMRKKHPHLVSLGIVPTLFDSVKLVDHHKPRMVQKLDEIDPEDAAAVRAALPGDWSEG